MHSKTSFLREALRSFKTSGTILPSSRFLVSTILKDINFNKAKILVELGPGNGVITKKILAKMSKDATLICFEINDSFIAHLQTFNDDRLIILKVSAENIILELQKLYINKIDYCVSSLPFTMIPKDVSLNILKNTFEVIKENGYFLQYQYSLSFSKMLKKAFGTKNVKITFEPLNIPPAFIYKCNKI